MISRSRTFMGMTLAVAISAMPLTFAAAQTTSEMTAEEITQAFEKQKTRGLVLVPADGTGTDTATETAAVQPAQTTYSQVDKADQVNIKIKFDFDSASLRDDQKSKLDTLCQVMNAVDVKLFQIVGHTDSSGSASYNENLSLLRAQEVKRHLVNECAVDENRLEAIGLGESAPFDASDPRSDDNRRVEFQALG
ncbi:outer membrane protein OmpA-like peptidoglycan-associated protein [Sulfitobacter mediterraneus]|jgi:OmpA-OmpF porin, OOP family|uniref:Outer membrane protein OmpA-like peptidoglycan-associated protein n=2 Tax=Sulfitobacter mediterraneus TaxID=83219 RepID=A0A2T6C926_9RHOB|nr:OmpA/MotB domain protein [Sulfitobacter mediterraneus KCTC 32188]PTX64783.1 outer membrane protein OmpA-like peptidoglycan-associated protein [Sulfitobacter mediterraneus]